MLFLFHKAFLLILINGPFVHRFDKVREVFDGELQDIIGYFSSFSGFQNWKRKEEKKASEFLAYVEKR